ncbi:MAG: hypothetical protein IJE44_06290 [Clostridia bacterium]|nr:hypothetical protein [Clostridia bacterium]
MARELKCKIADLKVSVTVLQNENRLIEYAEKYADDFSGESDINISFSHEFLEHRVAENDMLTLSEAEYIWTGLDFAKKLLGFGGLVLHASAVCYDDKVYLFSAPSGTGKSTHTSLWEKVFDGAFVINDDKPALRLIDGKIYVYGTPWSGKNGKNKNFCAPLGGICFISRSEENHIEKMTAKEAIPSILRETLRFPSIEFMEALLGFLDKNLKNIPVFKMGCNTQDEAATTAYNFMKKFPQGGNFYED